MSVNGPSALGTLLVQRIDAMLGTTLSQQANLVSGARPDAVSQPGNPQRPDATGNQVQRDPQEAVDRTRAQNENPSRAGVERGKLDPRTAEALLGRNAASTLTTPSAPTRLGFAAQTILALLAAYPDQSAAVQGRRPLLTSPPGTGGQQAGSAGQTGGSANAGNAQGTAGNAGAGGAAGQAGGAGTSQLNTPVQGVQGQAGNGASGTGNAAAGQAAGRPGAAGTTAPPNPVSGLNTAGAAALRAVAGTGNATPAMVGQLANALSQALQTSGMFYESHLGNLAFGRTPASQIQQEPQAQITQNQNTGSASSTANTSANPAGNNPAGGQAAGAPGAQNTAAAQAASQAGSAALANAASSNAAATRGAQPTLTLNGLDPQTHTLVRQQLEVLANQTFSWRGEVWPDAPMDWEIARREAWKELDGTEHPEHWATRLTLTLPNLGEVQARLTLAGDQLVMHLVSPESFGLLSQHTEELRARYRAQGLQLSQLSVAAFDNVGARAADGNTGVTAGEQRAAAGTSEPLAPNSEIDRAGADNPAKAQPQAQTLEQQGMAGSNTSPDARVTP